MTAHCRAIEIVYQATVTTNEKKETYVGLTATKFKTRWHNQMSLEHEKKRNDTELSKYLWELKEKKKNLQFHGRSSQKPEPLQI